MMKDMKWRLIIIAAVIGLSVWSFYPPSQKVQLGLDLKGGVYLVLRVKTDDALQLETETTVERLRDTLTRASVQYTKVDVVSPTEFRVEGIQNDSAFRDAAVDADTLVRSVVGGERLLLSDEAQHRQPAAGRRRHAVARDHRAAGQRAGCRRADRRPLRRTGSDRRPASGRHRRPAREGDHSLDGAAQADARRSGTRSRTGKSRCRPTTTRCHRMSRSCRVARKEAARRARRARCSTP